MAQRRTVDLLPEIFRTPTNRKFLAATLDQLTQEPNIQRTQGYVGRRIGPGVNPADNYLREPDAVRADYQLEPGVCFLRTNASEVEDAITYPGMLDSLDVLGADTERQDRLWQSQYYTWDPFCDLDKFTNYSQYYWIPNGPDAVDVSSADVPLTDEFEIQRNANSYTFSGVTGDNPVITLVRGGSYDFDVNQSRASFWIQSTPGINGRLPFKPNVSSRDVLGVINNGGAQGIVTFNVPKKDAQDFFYNLAEVSPVDLVTDLRFVDINNVYVDQFLAQYPGGIDGITNLNGLTLAFLNQNLNAEQGGWQVTTQFDPLPRPGAPRTSNNNIITGPVSPNDGLLGSYDTTLFDQITNITDLSVRYSVWRIEYVNGGDGRFFMRLSSVRPIPELAKFLVQFGAQYSGVQFYRNASGFFEQIPLLSAVLGTLFYQDGSNPDIFGQIRLIDPDGIESISIDDIVGAKNYTSPNGVVFTNGLKISFRGAVDPASLQNQDFYVEGVGTGPGIDQRVGFVDGEAYYGPFHEHQGQKMTGAVHTQDSFHQFIYDTVVVSLANMGAGGPADAVLPSVGQPNATRGNGIRLVSVRELVTPESYTQNLTLPYDSTTYDSAPYDEALGAPIVPDYITINRSGRDRNAWSRSNRWFHADVLTYAAELNNSTLILNNQARGKRPIIEFRANLELFNFGTQGKLPVNVIDFDVTDALSVINGSTGYGVDGYAFIEGTRVIFAADLDLQVRNRIYVVNFIDPDGDGNSPKIINLVTADDGQALVNQTTVSLNGNIQRGLNFWFDGATWQLAQQKTSVNQAPLFDVRDPQGRSFGDQRFYLSSTFAGNKLFGYALGTTQINDTVLGFPLKYLNINNVGDIVFQNYLYTDQFTYVEDKSGTQQAVSTGFVRQYLDRVTFSELIGWLPAVTENRSRQVFRFTNSTGLLVLDIPVESNDVVPAVQIFADGRYIEPSNYDVSVEGNNTFITMLIPVESGVVIQARVLSTQASATGFYEVPLNLENNPLNKNSTEFTLGTIRSQYETIGQNLLTIQGPIVGANNSRDLGDISRYGQNIVQNSAPLTLAGVFLREPQFEVVSAIKFNSQEYDKYKARLIRATGNGDFVNSTTTQILDTVLQELSELRDENSPFYWSDMIPAGETFAETTVTYSVISTPTFDLQRTYNFSASNFQGLLIYVNDHILTRGSDYTVGVGTPTVTVTVPLTVGDVIKIREYATTYGSFVPNTPTKMGLYPAYIPGMYLDENYVQPRMVIRGHDGSITVAYGDSRDEVLLEFETRIFNNLKIQSVIPIDATEVIPGQWRITDYSLAEINEILGEDFLSWVGWNKIDYTTQNYDTTNAFTYNYSQSSDKIGGQPLLGAWRGIYQYFYDTTSPNTTPWEMLGFSQEPAWWQTQYGPAPYTEGNRVLWEDLSQGLVKDPAGFYVLPQYARPDLISNVVNTVHVLLGGSGYVGQPIISVTAPPASRYAIPAQLGPAVIVDGVIVSIPIINPGRGYNTAPTITITSNSGQSAIAVATMESVNLGIPVDSEGRLLPPLDTVVGNYDANSFRRSWTVGDVGPAEYAWRSSSAWPFAVMRLLALTKPAKFFSLFADRDRYVFDRPLQQFLWDERFRLDACELSPLYGDGVSKASYINWIIDYNRQLGVNSTVRLENRLQNLDVRLCWRTAAFTDKRFLKIFSERSTPAATNTSLLLPDESFKLLLYNNPAFETLQYSSVIVQKTPGGFMVMGYDPIRPYFNVLTSRPNGATLTLTAGEITVNVAAEHNNNVVRVPYSYVFRNRAAVCDFLISYGEFLTRQGMTFEGMENGYVMNWQQMAEEFLYWSGQGWIDGSMINLNPASTRITVTRANAVAESLSPPRPDSVILNQNRLSISPENLIIDRMDNTISIEVTGNTSDTLNFFNLKFISYEHMVVLDNRSIFADLLYDPVTGARQSRVLVKGWLTADWNGTVNAPGFVLNQDNILDWIPSLVYTKGEIVRFKDELWAASTIIQPSETFNYTLWLRSDYDEISKGLLVNAAAASEQLSNSYSVFNANLEQEVDLFAYGLIGFRPRAYMQSLNLDDVSQVNLYQQFLGTKGTRSSAEIFSLADLGKEIAEYDIYEYWGILRGQYGANANRSYFEVLLDAPRLTSDPSVIELIQSGSPSQADQAVLIQDLWKTSYNITGTDILPVVTSTVTDRALPSAGYVNLDDVDFAVFDLDAVTAADVAQIGIGTTIWVAADGAYEWNVYRVARVPATVITVADNLDGRSLVSFNGAHGLLVNQLIMIRFFSPNIDGSYRVLSVPSINSLTIDFGFQGLQTNVTGTGLALELQSVRVTQASDVVNLPSSRLLSAGNLVWVDRIGSGTWAVLEKNHPFTQSQGLQPPVPVTDSRFGTSVAQGFFNLSALIGAPGYNPQDLATAPGALYSFVKSDSDRYEFNSVLTPGTTELAGYGNDIAIGDQNWAVAGASLSNGGQGYAVVIYRAPGSDAFRQLQLLNAGDLEFGATSFGHGVTISNDDQWIYIGAPGDESSQIGGAVYVFGRQDVQQQVLEFITDGATQIYTYSTGIVITDIAAWQMVVVLDSTLLTPVTDYAVSLNQISLNVRPRAGQQLIIARRQSAQLDQQIYRAVSADTTSGIGTGAKFLVDRLRGQYTAQLEVGGLDYAVGDTLTIDYTSINEPGVGTAANDLVITVTAIDPGTGTITEFTQSGSTIDDTDTFDLAYYFAQVSNVWDFSITVDGALLRPEQDYQYNTDGTVTFEPSALPPAGARIIVDAGNHFEYVDKIALPSPEVDVRFGHSVTTTTDGVNLIVGAPGADSESGQCYVYYRTVEKFLVQQSGADTFVTSESLIDPVSVTVNSRVLLNTALNIGGEYTVLSGNSISVNVDLQVGDIVSISTNHFKLVQAIQSEQPFETAQFGDKVDQCINDCSLYVAAPRDGSVRPEAGSVELWQNQARLYGIIISQIANPVLTVGNTISINGFVVAITGITVASLVEDINDAGLPNVTATSTPDLIFVADGQIQAFAVGSIYSVTQFTGSPITQVLLDDVPQTAGVDYVYDNTAQTVTLTATPIQNSVIKVISGRLVLTATNTAASVPTNKINVQPGVGTLWADLDLPLYVSQQRMASPTPQDFARFGSSIWISNDTTTLVIGSPRANLIVPTSFDSGTTQFDASSTNFADIVEQSGAVYTYDFLPAYQASATNPGQFVFGQQILAAPVGPLDQFGTSVNLVTGTLLMGAPTNDLDDSQGNFGFVSQFTNIDNQPSWQIKRQQVPAVNVDLLNTIYIYDAATSAAAQYLDFFDPLQGRMLGVVQQNLDFIGAIDPASYNVGPVNNRGNRWAQERVGSIWWNTTRVRFIDANQGDITYTSNRWGQVFPGSQVQVYQWVSSAVAPQFYTGPGQSRSIDSYVIVPTINEQGVFTDVYYFWVIDNDQVNTAAGKNISTQTMARYIEEPRASGIPYLAAIAPNTVALYNCEEIIAQGNSVLHVEFDKVLNNAAVHVEYQLVAQGRADGFLNANLYNKLVDSFCGTDVRGAAVPDIGLPVSERYGVAIRPRQSMFVNRFSALQNYLESCNAVLSQFVLSESRSYRLLNSADPEPSQASGQWNLRLLNDQELGYQDLPQVALGYRYLVTSDANNAGLWAIYEVVTGSVPGTRSLQLMRVQTYDTRAYWESIDWYLPGFDPFTRILLEVPVYASLATLTVPQGSVVKITANTRGRWELYRLDATGWTRVGSQNGTIRFKETLWDYQLGRFGFDAEVFDSQYFDQEPVIETRKIIQSINQELLIDDLLIERNRLLILMFNYILSEQLSPDWLTKTSLIDVDHTIRNLQPFQVYRTDNQDFVLQYINEVKPYHTQIREFGLIYRGQDIYLGNLTDFDVPAFWDATQGRFISPVLDNTGQLSTTSSTPSTSEIWQTFPWNQWFNNYLLNIQSVTVIDGGSGYTVPPQVVVTGTSQQPAVLTARINSAGRISAIDVQDPGEGYSVTALISFVGGNGIGGQAVAVMGNQLVRQFTTTMKYDRYQYVSSIQPWQAGQVYLAGDRVRYIDRAWQATDNDSAGFFGQTFDPDQWSVVPASELSGVDRTMGYYVPTPDQPGLDLALLITGVDYPGVQVSAPNFNQNTGFDVGNFDINLFDNISFGPEGSPTYGPGILDAIYESEFRDPFLGVLPAPAYAGDPPTTGPNPIVVAGGAFVDTYSSHAPEELVPGAMFDTLDLRVYTTPGADWLDDGHGFPIKTVRHEFDALVPEISFDGLLDLAVSITVFNVTTNTILIPGVQYVTSWVDNTVLITNGAVESDIIQVSLAALGGGNQLFTRRYLGAEIQDSLLIPQEFDLISQIVIFINGNETTSFSYAAQGDYHTLIDFDSPGLGPDDVVVVTVMGNTDSSPVFSWSLPVTQYITVDAGTVYGLTNNLGGTNAVDVIVSVDGRRVRPYNNLVYVSDGTTVTFEIPVASDILPGSIGANQVAVYVDDTALILNVDFFLDPWDGSTDLTVTLVSTPPAGVEVLVSVSTGCPYSISGSNLILIPGGGLAPAQGSIISVTTFNDTRQQDIFTRVYVGPNTQGLQFVEGYDETLYDFATVSDEPGSFDFGLGTVIANNRFDCGREITDSDRVVVSQDGRYLFQDRDYQVQGRDVVLIGPPINSNSVVAITSFTMSTVPGAIAFRIFQDMRGLQSLYRITPDSSTVLTAALSSTGNVISVMDASRLDEPNLEQGIFGLITINGERIAYRERNLITNTVSGLRRGTAGTAAAAHSVGSDVLSIGAGNLLPSQYQRSTIADNFLANGTQTEFVAANIVIEDIDSTELVEAVQVYVGGILQLSGYSIEAVDPVRITFETAPPAGYQVSIRVNQATVMYAPGLLTPSNGRPLQETNTAAARFIRDE